MILNFKEYWPQSKKWPTDFKNKILRGEKVHSMRSDKHKRWRVGMKIHFSTGARTPRYKCFKEGVVKTVQQVEINADGVLVDQRKLNGAEAQKISMNDGFTSLSQMKVWFKLQGDFPFKGVLIHWTDLKY